MSELADLVEPLKRYVAVPGTFADVFPDTTDDDLTGTLLDAFSEAQLDGYFTKPVFTADDDGTVTPDLDRGQAALVVLYAGIRIITAQLTNLTTLSRYQAGNLVYETQRSAQVLTAALKDLQSRRDALQKRSALLGAGTAFEMADQFWLRQVGIDWGYSAGYSASATPAYGF